MHLQIADSMGLRDGIVDNDLAGGRCRAAFTQTDALPIGAVAAKHSSPCDQTKCLVPSVPSARQSADTCLHEVAGRAGGDVILAKDELLRYAAAQRHRHLVLQVRAAANRQTSSYLAEIKRQTSSYLAEIKPPKAYTGLYLRHTVMTFSLTLTFP